MCVSGQEANDKGALRGLKQSPLSMLLPARRERDFPSPSLLAAANMLPVKCPMVVSYYLGGIHKRSDNSQLLTLLSVHGAASMNGLQIAEPPNRPSR